MINLKQFIDIENMLDRTRNTESFLNREYTLDEFENEGLQEIVSKYLQAKERADKYGSTIVVKLEYYPYTAGTKCLEIVFDVKD